MTTLDMPYIRDILLTMENHIILKDEMSGEFEAGNNRNMVIFEVSKVK